MGTLKAIAEKLLEAQSVLIYPHIHMDADALGSAAALCRGLRKLGKESFIHIEDDVAGNLQFLDKGYCTLEPDMEPDVCICVDCSGENRIPERYEAFRKGKTTLVVDHHRTAEAFADLDYVDPDAAATGELIYDLLGIMGIEIDKELGEALFAALATDTGKFQYSNTTKRTHEIVMALYDSGMDHMYVSNEIYENNSYESLLLETKIMSTLERFADGKGIIAHVTQEMLRETGTTMDETEAIVGKLRAIRGVEVAAFLKEHEENVIKSSLRAKTYADVAVISSEFGGGGHIKAAGCTMNMPMEEARETMKDRITKQLVRE